MSAADIEVRSPEGGSGQSSPFVHPDRQMSVVGTADEAESSKKVDTAAGAQDTEMSAGVEPPQKRQRTMNLEEKKRGQRLFGNLLGQLNKFSKEEKEAAKTARVKAREEIAARVASKIQGETKRVHEISEHEKGVRSARHEYERVQTVLREAELEAKSRARHLPQVSHFLLTSSTWVDSKNGDGALFLALAPPRDPQTASTPKPLYYRPRKLLPEQEDILEEQAQRAKDLIIKEGDALEILRAETRDKLAVLSEKRATAQEKLEGVRQQDVDKQVEKLGESMEVDGAGKTDEQKDEGKTADETKGTAAETPAPATSTNNEADMELEAADAERGGREGDEVEY